jgi:transcriptional regulator with XRE-family HTH domain
MKSAPTHVENPLRARRIALGVQLEEVALRAGRSKELVKLYEYGYRPKRQLTLRRIERALDELEAEHGLNVDLTAA